MDDRLWVRGVAENEVLVFQFGGQGTEGFVDECEAGHGRFRLHDRGILRTIGVSFNEGRILLCVLEVMWNIHREP